MKFFSEAVLGTAAHQVNPLTGLAEPTEKPNLSGKVEDTTQTEGLKYKTFSDEVIREKGSPADAVFGLGVRYDLDPTKFNFTLRTGADNIELRARNQSVMEQLGNGLVRLVGTTLTKSLTGLGYLGSLPKALFTWDLNAVFDNEFSRVISDFEEHFKEDVVPIHHRRKYLEGNILKQMGTFSFWMDDVIDGVAFMASAMGGSYGMSAIGKGIGAYTKLAKQFSKLTKAARMGDAPTTMLKLGHYANVSELATITLFNSVVEGAFEAKDLKDTMLSQGFSAEQASEAARKTFLWNTLALMPSNFLTNKLILQGFKAGTSSRIIPGTNKLKPLTGKEKTWAFFEGMFASMLSEGPYEENIQESIQNYFLGVASGEGKRSSELEGIIEGMIKNFSTDEGQKAIVLGSLIGMLPGGIGGVKSLRNEVKNEQKALVTIGAVATALKESAGFGNLWATDTKGQFIKDDQGNPVVDSFKVADAYIRTLNSNAAGAIMEIAKSGGKDILYEGIMDHLVSNLAFAALSHPDGRQLFEYELRQLLEQHISEALSEGEEINEDQIDKMLSKYLTRFDKSYSKVYDNVMNNFAGLYEFSKDSKDLLAGEVKAEAMTAQYLAAVKQLYWNEKLNELESAKAELLTSVLKDTPDSQSMLKAIEGEAEFVENMIKDSKAVLKHLVNEKNWTKQYTERFKAKQEAEKKLAEEEAGKKSTAPKLTLNHVTKEGNKKTVRLATEEEYESIEDIIEEIINNNELATDAIIKSYDYIEGKDNQKAFKDYVFARKRGETNQTFREWNRGEKIEEKTETKEGVSSRETDSVSEIVPEEVETEEAKKQRELKEKREEEKARKLPIKSSRTETAPETRRKARKESPAESLRRPVDRGFTGAEQIDEEAHAEIDVLNDRIEIATDEIEYLRSRRYLNKNQKARLAELEREVADAHQSIKALLYKAMTQDTQESRMLTLEALKEKYGDPRYRNMTLAQYFEDVESIDNNLIVIYHNVAGELFIDPETNEVIFKELDTGKETIVTKTTNEEFFAGEYTISDLGIVPIRHTIFNIEISENFGEIIVQGRKYHITAENPLSAIDHVEGVPVSVTLFDAVGNLMTFTHPALVAEISYSLALMEEARIEAELALKKATDAEFLVVKDPRFKNVVVEYYVYRTSTGYKIVKPRMIGNELHFQLIKTKKAQNRILEVYYRFLDEMLESQYKSMVSEIGVREQERLEQNKKRREDIVNEIKDIDGDVRPPAAKETLSAPGIGEVQTIETEDRSQERGTEEAGRKTEEVKPEEVKPKEQKPEEVKPKEKVEEKTEEKPPKKNEEDKIIDERADELAKAAAEEEERRRGEEGAIEESIPEDTTGVEALTRDEQVTDKADLETSEFPDRGLKHTATAVAWNYQDNPEANVFFSDPNNTLEGHTLVAEIDWENSYWKDRETSPEKVAEDLEKNKPSTKHFNSFVDNIPIKLVLYDKEGNKVPVEGLYYHRSSFDNIVLPEKIRKLAKEKGREAANIEYEKLREAEMSATRAVRMKIIPLLLKGEKVTFKDVHKTQGILSQNPGQNRPLSSVTDTSNLIIGVATEDGNIYYRGVLSESSTADAMGAVFWECKDTCNGKPYSIMLNPTKLSEDEAMLLYEAYKLAANSPTATNTLFINPNISGEITVREFINLMVFEGPATDQSVEAQKARNRLPKRHLAEKRLMLKKGVLHYGKNNQLDLRKENTPGQIKAFVEHIINHKNHSVSQGGALSLGKKMGIDIVIGTQWKNRKPIVVSKGMSYEQFVADNEFVVTDVTREQTTNRIFSAPVIIFDTGEYLENIEASQEADRVLKEAKESAKKKAPDKETGKKKAESRTELSDPSGTIRINKASDLKDNAKPGDIIVQIFESVGDEEVKDLNAPVQHRAFLTLGSIVEKDGKLVFTVDRVASKEMGDKEFDSLTDTDINQKGFVKSLYDVTFSAKGNIALISSQPKATETETSEETEEVEEAKPEIKEPPAISETVSKDTDFAKLFGDIHTKPGRGRAVKEGEHKKGNIEKMTSYLSSKFGKRVTVKTVNKLIEVATKTGSELNWGLMTADSIVLFEAAEIGTEYHEAYHRVSLLYLSPKQRAALYQEIRNRDKSLEKLSDREIEEILAEEFRDYKLALDEKEEPKKSLPKRILEFFSDLLEFLYTVVTGRLFAGTPTVNTMFKTLAKDGGIGNRVKFARENKKSMQDFAKNDTYYRKVRGVEFDYIPNREAVDSIVQTLVFSTQRLNNITKVEDLNSLDLLAPRELMLKSSELAFDKAQKAERDGNESLRDEYMYRSNMFKEVYDNYENVFVELMKEQFYDLGIEMLIPERELAPEDNTGEDLVRLQKSTFEINHKETASSNVKLAIKTLPSGDDVNPITLLPTFVDFDYMWNSMMYDLHSFNSIEEMESALSVKAETSVPHAALLKKLRDSKEDEFDTFRTQFYATMKKNRYYMYNVGFVSKGGKTSFNVGSAETLNLASTYASLWGNAFVRSEYFKDGRPNSEKIGELTDRYEELAKKVRQNYTAEAKVLDNSKEIVAELSEILMDARIDADMSVLNHIFTNMNKETYDEAVRAFILDKEYRMLAIFGKRGTLNQIATTGILRNNKGQEIPLSDVFKNESVLRNIIGEAYSNVKTEQFTHSVIGPGGNSYYLFAENSYLTDVVNDLRNNIHTFKELTDVIYNKNSVWLDQMKDSKIRKNLKLNIISSFAQENTGDLGRKYSEVNDVEDHLIKLTLLNRRVPIVALPTLGERDNLFSIEGVKPLDFEFQYNPETNIILWPSEIIDVFEGYINDERAAIQQVTAEINLAEETGNTSNLIKSYHYKDSPLDRQGNGLKYRHFEDLAGRNLTGKKLRDYIIDTLEERLEEMLAEFTRLKIITSKVNESGMHVSLRNALIDDSFVKKNIDKFDGKEGMAIKNIVASYMVNIMSSTIESEKIFSMDPAYYKNAEDKIKRIALLSSPGTNLRLYFDSETLKGERLIHERTYNTSYLNTQLYRSEKLHAELTKSFIKIFEERGMSTEKARQTAEVKLRKYLEVDQTDGQAYITPQMHRALKIRLGEWTKTDQKAYDLMTSGEKLTAADQRIVDNLYMEPLKFVSFGRQPGRNSSAPVIFKMSLATLTPQLIEGSELLGEIYDRMQDETDPIDMLLFDSAVKVGMKEAQNAMAVDEKGNRIEGLYDRSSLNNLMTYRQDFKYLRRSQVTEPKMETEVLLGTQFKKMAMANIYPDKEYFIAGEKVKGSDVLDFYKTALEHFSDYGKEEVSKKFGWDKTGTYRVDKNKEYEFMAERARMSRMPDAVVEALLPTLNAFIEYDALSDRKWVLATAISLITRHTVDLHLPGAAMIQMSNFGLRNVASDQSLRMFDEEGFVEAKVSIEIFRKAIPNYNNLTLDERIKAAEKLVKGVGYRIPTQGPNSAVAVKIVDFLPSTSTTTISLPAEFTALTGSDFDIDKLYFVTHNFDTDEKGNMKVVEYLHEENSTLQERLEAYSEEALRDEISQMKKAHRIAFKQMYEERGEFKKALSELYSEREGLEENMSNEVLDPETASMVEKIKDEISKNRVLLRSVSDMLQQAKDMLGIDIEEAKKEWVKKNAKEFSERPIIKQNTTRAIQNRTVDVFSSVLRSNHHVLETKTPLDSFTSKLKNLANDVIAKEGYTENRGALSLTSPVFHAQVRKKYSSGQDGIGPFALHNVHHVLGQMVGLYYNDILPMGLTTTTETGRTVTDLSAREGLDKEFILDWFSALLSAFVDIAKDPYVFALNVNAATYDAVALMLRAGYGEDTFAFMSQPILKEYADAYIMSKGKLKSVRGKAAQIVKKRYSNLLSTALREEKINNKDLKEENSFNKERLLEDIGTAEGKSAAFYFRQLKVLEHFLKINKAGYQLNLAVQASQVDTKKFGNNFVMLKRFSNLVNKVRNEQYIGNIDKLFDDTFLGTLYKNSVNLAFDMFSESTLTASSAYLDTVDDIMMQIGRTYDVTNKSMARISKVADELFASIAGRFFTGTADITASKLKELLTGSNSLAHRVLALKNNPKYEGNTFLKLLNPTIEASSNNINYILLFNGIDKSSKFQKDKLISAWSDLHESSEQEVRDIAMDLVFYSFFTSGFRTHLNSFFSYIDPKVLEDIGYKDYIRESREILHSQDAYAYMSELKEDVFKSLWQDDTFVPYMFYEDFQHRMFEVDENGKKLPYPSLIQIDPHNNMSMEELFIGYNMFNAPMFAPFVKSIISNNTVIYKYVGYRPGKKAGVNIPIYAVTNKLGEFNPKGQQVKENGLTESVFSNNNVVGYTEAQLQRISEEGPAVKSQYSYRGFVYMTAEERWLDKATNKEEVEPSEFESEELSTLETKEEATETVKTPAPKFSMQMIYEYGEGKRSDVSSKSTFEAIQAGERTASTRYESQGHIDYWKNAKVGDVIQVKNKAGQTLNVIVTKELTKLSENTNAEEWSKKEGWSTEYFERVVKPKLGEAWQLEFKLASETTTAKSAKPGIVQGTLTFENMTDKQHEAFDDETKHCKTN